MTKDSSQRMHFLNALIRSVVLIRRLQKINIRIAAETKPKKPRNRVTVMYSTTESVKVLNLLWKRYCADLKSVQSDYDYNNSYPKL